MNVEDVNRHFTDAKSTVSLGQIIKLLQIMEDQGLTFEQFRVLLKCEIFEDMFERVAKVPDRELWRRTLNLSPLVTAEEYSNVIMVDYDLLLPIMLEAGGYDCVELPMTLENVLINGQGIHYFEPAYFRYPEERLSSQDIRIRIRNYDLENPWEPAEFEHLLAQGARQREEQREKIIVSLGINLETTPYLVGNTQYRGLNEQCGNTMWSYGEYFLAIRKIKPRLLIG